MRFLDPLIPNYWAKVQNVATEKPDLKSCKICNKKSLALVNYRKTGLHKVQAQMLSLPSYDYETKRRASAHHTADI